MKISMAEFMVLMDTLGGSLSISDGGHVFGYAKETRQGVWQSLHERGKQETVANVPTDEDGDGLPK